MRRQIKYKVGESEREKCQKKTHPLPAIASTPTVFSGLLMHLSLQIMLAFLGRWGRGVKSGAFANHAEGKAVGLTCVLLRAEPSGHIVSVAHPLRVVHAA